MKDIAMLSRSKDKDPGLMRDKIQTLEAIERDHIIKALKQTSWKIHGKEGAAEILGINPNTLRSRMKKLNISKP
jgi:transcriptional regulator with GAF, ATPase, and Fis domain